MRGIRTTQPARSLRHRCADRILAEPVGFGGETVWRQRFVRDHQRRALIPKPRGVGPLVGARMRVWNEDGGHPRRGDLRAGRGARSPDDQVRRDERLGHAIGQEGLRVIALRHRRR